MAAHRRGSRREAQTRRRAGPGRDHRPLGGTAVVRVARVARPRGQLAAAGGGPEATGGIAVSAGFDSVAEDPHPTPVGTIQPIAYEGPAQPDRPRRGLRRALLAGGLVVLVFVGYYLVSLYQVWST